MQAAVLARSQSLRWTFLFSMVLLQGNVRAAVAQAAPSQAVQSAIPGADPTQRETQPNLGIEHDPVLSPDANDNTPGSAAGKELTKDAGSNVYTLRQNVDEVLLRCAVVDGKGSLVEDLKQGDFRVWGKRRSAGDKFLPTSRPACIHRTAHR